MAGAARPRPGDFDPARISDPRLREVADKYTTGIRLDGGDALAMFATPDILGLGMLADHANRTRHGDVVTFAANQHLNPTNVCILRKTCVFCSFARLPKEEGAYHYTLDEVWEEAKAAESGLTREFHIVGGLDMKAGLTYYSDIFRGLKERYPHVHIKALTAVEIAHIARIEKMSVREVLVALREAGLDTLPGGGAEVFGKAVRATIADRKLVAEEWIDVHRTAHQLGIRSNCTMLYGHVETHQDRAEHLQMLRDLQDETGGFLAYIPLAYHPDHNELGRELGREGTATTGFDDLKNLAVGRLFLDSIEHVKTHWVMVTPFLSQTALSFGVNDVEGTVVREKVYHEAGAQTSEHMSLEEILSLIRGAGKIAAERDSLYNVLRVFDDGGDGNRPPAAGETPAGRTSAIGGNATGLRIGRIPYVNCYPVYGAIDRGIVALDGEIVSGVPTELNGRMAAGQLDVSVVSAVEYARTPERYLLLPDLAISCDGPVQSVVLCSKLPAPELGGRTVIVSRSSMTSAALLELLFSGVWNARPRFVPGDAEVSDLGALGQEQHDARLVIGDAALLLTAGDRSEYPHVYDLGREWKRWTGLPFVFAVWVARRSVPVAESLRVHASLIAARDWGLQHLDELAAEASDRTGVAVARCRSYLSGLDYGLSYPHLAGLTEFFRRLVEVGRVPNGTLTFLPAA